MKNKIVLYTGSFELKERVELVDFTEVKHVVAGGRALLRVLCGSKCYYYPVTETTISEIQIYEF